MQKGHPSFETNLSKFIMVLHGLAAVLCGEWSLLVKKMSFWTAVDTLHIVKSKISSVNMNTSQLHPLVKEKKSSHLLMF